MSSIRPILLAGGAGVRLWPLSRTARPKQFLPLMDGGESLYQVALKRAQKISTASVIVITNNAHRFMAAEQAREIGVAVEIILEPDGRDTAASIALASSYIAMNYGDNTHMLVLAADHYIPNSDQFRDGVYQAKVLASKDFIVTFGITPTRPDVGYGYIQSGKPIGDVGFEVSQFVEKPDKETAQSYLLSGRYLWNSGIFLATVKIFQQELKLHAPGILDLCNRSISLSRRDLDFIRIDEDLFSQIDRVSIDYAVMEHTDCAAVIPLSVEWSDLGGFLALAELGYRDVDGNVGATIAMLSTDNYIVADERVVALLGVKDLVVVDTDDALLVAHKSRLGDIKSLVSLVEKKAPMVTREHRKVYRPWGCYDSIDCGDQFKVKRISVNPRSRLSLQMHHHRAEHWIVVKGIAKVTVGDRVSLVNQNESTYIPIGERHSLENPSDLPLELIEVQTGDYLGEDDIVRFQDDYGRVNDSVEDVQL